MKFNIEEELKKLPAKPGVYLMHDELDHIIYVGKAVVLKNRVRQYFQKSRNVSVKIEKMISQIAWFEYIVTDSELEALVLECNLIKEYNPKYNTMLKDGKSYPFLKAVTNVSFPYFTFSRQMKRDNNRYFGPFTSGAMIRDTIEVLNSVFKLRNCRKIFPRDKGKERPCMYYDMHMCEAPCNMDVDEEAYRARFDEAIKVLEGDTAKVIDMLTARMTEYSKNLQFEDAARYRDHIVSIRRITDRQKITGDDGEDRDIIAIEKNGDDAVAQVFFVRNGKLLGRDHYYLKGVSHETDEHVLSEFIKQMYSGTPYIPHEIWTQKEPEDAEIIREWLKDRRGKNVIMSVPKRGQKHKLLELARKNAKMLLEKDAEKLKREYNRTRGALDQIQSWLGITGLSRVESYDISNINGFENVGSMVVFEEGKPKKNDYRKFRIKSFTGADDYRSMEEVLTRRFTHGMRENLDENDSFRRFPDIIFMDGGRGQVNVCERVLDELGIEIPVCGMVKDDNHRTRGLYFNNVEIEIDTHSEGFKLITRIQDETHRFAIDYHRQIRAKKQVHSILDDIPNIGPARRRALMRNFTSIEDIKNATEEELAAIAGMDARSAKSVFEFFNKK